MNFRASRDILYRNLPGRLRELDSANTPEEVTKILAKSRSKDPTFLAIKAEPDRIVRWIRVGMSESGAEIGTDRKLSDRLASMAEESKS
jgi:hypothetical protein